MERTMKIKGMMCGHCEARVQKCLAAIPGVAEAKVNYKKDVAVVKLAEAVDDETLKSAVEAEGYTVISVK